MKSFYLHQYSRATPGTTLRCQVLIDERHTPQADLRVQRVAKHTILTCEVVRRSAGHRDVDFSNLALRARIRRTGSGGGVIRRDEIHACRVPVAVRHVIAELEILDVDGDGRAEGVVEGCRVPFCPANQTRMIRHVVSRVIRVIRTRVAVVGMTPP